MKERDALSARFFQVGNIGELSDDDIRYFLSTLKDVLLTLQADAADLVALVRLKHARLALLPTPVPAHVRVVVVLCGQVIGGVGQPDAPMPRERLSHELQITSYRACGEGPSREFFA